MATPANNPFGAPPSQVLNNPFGAPTPASSQSAPAPNQQFQNPFGAPATQSNPFGTPAANPFGAPVKNPFGAPTSGPKEPSGGAASGGPSAPRSVFGSPALSPGSSSRQLSPAPPLQLNNPFGAPPTGPKSSRTPSPSGSRAQSTEPSNRSSGTKATETNGMARKNKPAGSKPVAPANAGGGSGGGSDGQSGGGGQGTKGGAAGKGGSSSGSGFGRRQGDQNQGNQLANPFASTNPFAKQPAVANSTQSRQNARGKQQVGRQERHRPPSSSRGSGQKIAADRGPTERTKELSSFAYDYANKLYDHLKKEGIHPPKWPADPGDPSKRGAIENLKDAYKKYRSRVYASLRKADLIDDPDKRRKLEDALPFKGICESMCPEFEQVSRIAEYDVKTEEKELRPDGVTMWPDPAKMVKKFGRSAAGQDAPLPMDVRSVDALRRTTDYLFNDLLQSESNLPSMHNFLWDRTRAVRKDFTFHSQKTAEEMKDMVYCFETITRFHATALHLLSKKGVANEDFDQKQEIEQLGRTILSLVEAYDVCRDKRVHCENEAEFRAYYLLLNAHDPSITRRIPTWGAEFWFESEEVQTALSLIQAMDDVREPKGPIKPRVGTTLSDTSFTNYFSIVEDPRVSYTMACIAEIHFTSVRQAILRNLVRGYARHRDAPRTITASELNAMLRFDTPEEAVEFAELHGFEFSTWVPEGRNPVTEPYLLLNNKKKVVPSPRVRQSFSGTLVERKRTTQSLPYVIYNTIYEETAEKPPGGSPISMSSEDGGLFVTQTPASELLVEASPTPTPPPPSKPSAPPTTSSWSFGSPTSSTPFGMGASSTAPAFSGFTAQPPKPTESLLPGSSAPSGQPTPQPQVGQQTPFASLNSQFAAPSTTAAGTTAIPTTTPVQGQPSLAEQTKTTTETTSTSTASPFAPAKPTEGSSPFGFLNNSSVPSLSNLAHPSQPQTSTASPSVPSLFGNASSKPVAAFAPSQETTTAQKKLPESALPTSNLGSTNPAVEAAQSPATTILPGQTTQQTTGTLSAVPTIHITPPSTTAPAAQGLQPPVSASPSKPFGQAPQPSRDAGAPAPSTVAPKPPPPPKRDLLGDFTRWFVKGDDGLMEQFTEEYLRHILWGVWQDFERERAEKKRKEEDEESWRQAREHQAYRLRLKYFYRWRDNARALATKRILREGKEKMRLYREQQREVRRRQQEEKEKADREAKRAAERQLMEDTHRFSLLASSTRSRRRGSVAYSADYVSNNDPEEQLLASGVFSGLRDDPRSVARRIVRETAGDADNNNNHNEAWATGSATRSLRYPESELELELEPARTSSPDTSSVGGGKREGWKTRSLRERFGLEPRRSLSAGGGSLASLSSRFRQSLPGTNSKTTNFAASMSSSSRKRSAGPGGGEEEDDDLGAKRLLQHGSTKAAGSGLARSTHWELRARGFVPMPDGKWLPEALANKQQQQQQAFGSPEDGPADGPDFDMASDAGRTASPTPSDWRLRLEKLKKYRPLAHHHGHSSRHSIDLPQHTQITTTTMGFSTSPKGILSTSPPHPPFASAAAATITQPPPPPPPPPPPLFSGWRAEDGLVSGVGKRKRGLDDTGEKEDVDVTQQRQSREPSPSPSVKRKALATGASVVPGRAETYAMVENTKRMLRELREAMDRADRDAREEVY
ncbi:hypothetical protein VTH82DRAFT_1962 [Thermothelomyces myriococcoides]